MRSRRLPDWSWGSLSFLAAFIGATLPLTVAIGYGSDASVQPLLITIRSLLFESAQMWFWTACIVVLGRLKWGLWRDWLFFCWSAVRSSSLVICATLFSTDILWRPPPRCADMVPAPKRTAKANTIIFFIIFFFLSIFLLMIIDASSAYLTDEKTKGLIIYHHEL